MNKGSWLSIIEYADFRNISIAGARSFIKTGKVKSELREGKHYILVNEDDFKVYSKDREKKYEEALQDYIKALGIDHVAVAGPGLGTIILNYKFKSSSVKERALYLNEQLQLPKEERVLTIKEVDEGQVMHKPGKL